MAETLFKTMIPQLTFVCRRVTIYIMNKKFPIGTSVRLTTDGEKMCRLLLERLGINRTGVVELAIRRLADLEGITKSDIDQYVLIKNEEIVE